MHAAHDLARVAAFARTELRNDARLGEIELGRDAIDQRARTRDDRGHLKGTLQKSPEEQNAHEVPNFYRRPPDCPVTKFQWNRGEIHKLSSPEAS